MTMHINPDKGQSSHQLFTVLQRAMGIARLVFDQNNITFGTIFTPLNSMNKAKRIVGIIQIKRLKFFWEMEARRRGKSENETGGMETRIKMETGRREEMF